MKFIVHLTLAAGKSVEEVQALMAPEVRGLWMSYKGNRLRETYFSPSPPVVSLVYEVPDLAAVDAELDALPMIKAGLLDRQVVALEPFVQFEALFDGDVSAT